MKILIVHNRYQQRGGEDSVVEDEIALLRAGGHKVSTVMVSNDAIVTVADKLRAAFTVADGPLVLGRVVEAACRENPDVVHVHNFFPLISPAVHARVRAIGPATVQTLHNFRITCAGANLLRDGRPCGICVGRSPLPGIVHRCYRGSLVGSAAVASMIAQHRRRGTWLNEVDRFIALSRFGRDIFVRAGVPADKIVVKPNAVDEIASASSEARSGVVYVGRLSTEKGVRVLAEAARLTRAPISVIGGGPEAAWLGASLPENLRLLGEVPRAEAREAMARAQAVVVPSICYETFSITVAEAFAANTPVIASCIGSLAEIVEDGRTGWQVPPGDPVALAAAIDLAMADPAACARRGVAARQTYLARYTPQAALVSLEAIYADAIASRHLAGSTTAGSAEPFALHQTGETTGLS